MAEANKSVLTRFIFDAAVAIKTREINKYVFQFSDFSVVLTKPATFYPQLVSVNK